MLNFLNNIMVGFLNLIHTGVEYVFSSPNISFGLSIILMTIIIRIILFPLNYKSTKSMLVMNEVQPLLQKVQDKYKNDPQKMQQETLKIYKEKGVSPLGGCLPMLIQWPILIAMFYAFNAWKDMEGHGFLWVQNLAKPDTMFIIPILAAATTFLTGMATATNNTSESQKKTTNTMNIAMTVMIFFMSMKTTAALGFYWVVSNVFTIGQNLVVKKMMNKNKEQQEATEVTGAKEIKKPKNGKRA